MLLSANHKLQQGNLLLCASISQLQAIMQMPLYQVHTPHPPPHGPMRSTLSNSPTSEQHYYVGKTEVLRRDNDSSFWFIFDAFFMIAIMRL